MAQIGIKLADGSFYPILDGDHAQRKRLTLTVASPGQAHAQIDILERGDDGDRFVGSLVLDDLGTTDGELELVVGLNADNQLDAQITDHTGEQYQSLAADLDALEDAGSWSMDVDDQIGDIGSVDSLNDIDLPDLDDDADDDLGGLDLEAALDESDEDFSMPRYDGDDNSDDELALPEFDEDDGALDLSMDLDDGDSDLAAPDFSMPDIPMPGDGDESWDDADAADRDDESAGLSYAAPDGSPNASDELSDPDDEEEVEPRPFQPLVLAAIILISLSLIALGAFGLFSWLSTDPLPPLRAALATVPGVVSAPV